MIRQRRASRWGSWLIVILVVAILVIFPSLRSASEHGFATIVTPITTLARRLGGAIRLPADSDATRVERDQLRTQVAALTAKLADAQSRLAVGQALATINEFVQHSQRHVITAAIESFSPDPGVQSFVIDRGRRDGVAVGQAVIADQGYVIGKIQTVHEGMSTVLAVTDGQMNLAAKVSNAAGSQGVVRGERGLSVRMEYLPKSDQVASGELVTTSGIEPMVPPGLLIGSIGQTSTKSGELFQQATIILPIQLSQVQVVGVVQP